MSDKEGSFFGRITTKIKLVFAGIAAAVGFIFIVIFNRRSNQVKMLKHELKTIRSEIEIQKASEDIEENNNRIEELEILESDIKRKILELDGRPVSDEVTNEELDKFFDDRGF
tara:strand:+ start:5747 stop:6085 length:339 start_codon:yes stop_codon:yes gene_type:complete